MTDILTKPVSRLRLSMFLYHSFSQSQKKDSLVLSFISYIIMFSYFQMKKNSNKKSLSQFHLHSRIIE